MFRQVAVCQVKYKPGPPDGIERLVRTRWYVSCLTCQLGGPALRMNDGSRPGGEVDERSHSHDGDALDQLGGFLMLVIFLFIHEPIWLYLSADTTNILRAIPVVAYVIVAAVLMIRGGPVRDET